LVVNDLSICYNIKNIPQESRMNNRQKQIDPDKVAIYIRWSTDDQSHGTTLEVQHDTCKHFVISQGWNYNESLLFVDDGYSGGTLDRPQMKILRKKVVDGEINCVVVFKIDRLSRSVLDTVTLVLDEWEDITYVKSAREPIDTTNPIGKQFFYMLISFAEWERNVIRDRTFSGKTKRAEHGKNPGFKPPYGYEVGDTPGTFKIVPDEAVVIKRIFEEYLDGLGMQKIAFNLNYDGIRFRDDKFWNDSTISHILQNELYTGRLIYGRISKNSKRKKNKDEKYWIKHDKPLSNINSQEIEPIIDEKTFMQVNEYRKSKNVFLSKVSGRIFSSPHLLTGLMKCKCGHALLGFKQRPKDNYAYYKCSGARMKGKLFCNASYIRQDIVDNKVVNFFKSTFSDDNLHSGVIDELMKQHDKNVSFIKKAINDCDLKKGNLQNEVNNIEKDYRSGKLTAIRFEKFMLKIETEINEIDNYTIDLKRELDILESKIIDKNKYDKLVNMLLKWNNALVSERKSLLRDWIDHIIVYKERDNEEIEIKVFYNWQKPH
jgi:site-specific DNA recombinase